MKILTIAACLALTAVSPGLAANAGNPYGNVDHRNDAGNDTGDSQVDRLNEAQLTGGMAPRRARQWPSRSYDQARGAYPQGAYGYAPQRYAQPGYAPPGYAQSGYAQPGYAQPGYMALPPGYPYYR